MNHIADGADFARAFGVSRETLVRLETYAGLLVRWQKAINLVAPATLPDAWHRHFADSAQLLALAPDGPLCWVDLGSGGGFPGLVIGCMLAERPGSRVKLVESDSRKVAFLREVVRQTELARLVDVDIVAKRIESVAIAGKVAAAKAGLVDVVSARALAPLDRLFGWCLPFFGASTIGLLPKGRDVAAEIEAARRRWAFESTLVASRTADDASVVVVSGLVALGTEGR